MHSYNYIYSIVSACACLICVHMCASLYVSVFVYTKCHLYEYLCVSSSDFNSNFSTIILRSFNQNRFLFFRRLRNFSLESILLKFLFYCEWPIAVRVRLNMSSDFLKHILESITLKTKKLMLKFIS